MDRLDRAQLRVFLPQRLGLTLLVTAFEETSAASIKVDQQSANMARLSPSTRISLSHALFKLIAILSSSALPLLASPVTLHPLEHNDSDDPDVETGSAQFWINLAVVAVLVLLGGCFAGLTLGQLVPTDQRRSRR